MRSLYNVVFGRRSRTCPVPAVDGRSGDACDYCGFGNVTSLPWVGLSVE